MSCAKFLSIAALGLGLATFAVVGRAAPPADYDFETMLRHYNNPSIQAIFSDDSSPATSTATDDTSAASAKDSASASRASYDDSDNGSALCDQQEPARLSTSTSSVRAPSRSTADRQLQSVRHGVRQAAAYSSSNYGVASDDDMSQPAVPSGPAPRSTRSSSSQSQSSSVWSGGNNSNHDSESADQDHPTPEVIGPGGDSCDGGECGECADCDQCACDSCWFNPCGCCGWFAGADYLLVRPDFSDAPAFVKITGEGSSTENFTIIQQKFSYQSSVRAFFGYRTQCGDEIRFTYWNLQDGGSLTVTPGVDVAYGGQFMTRANVPGDSLTNDANLEMNVYDLDYVKCCCNPCGCQSCCCPVWTLSYSAGIRVASMRRTDNTFQSLATPTSDPTAGFISASFIGAGPRVGLEGHRYFRGTRASLFARGNIALLLGEYDEDQAVLVTTPDRAVTRLFNDHDRIIPETDIEIGADWQMTRRLKLSAGYLFQAWWDLGEFEHIDVLGSPSAAGFIQPSQNSNILGFDGLFARLEYCF